MTRILTAINYYLPGHKAGGTIRGLANLVEYLGNEFEFCILTSDRDLGDNEPYSTVIRGDWQQVGQAKVRYLSPHEMKLFAWHNLLRSLDYDLIYLIGFFPTMSIKTLLLRRTRQIPEKPIILFPQGEFSPGALALKRYKKRTFIYLAKLTGLYRKITWQASSTHEMQDICAVFKHDIDSQSSAVHIASNLPAKMSSQAVQMHRAIKQPGSARLVFLSRITRMKNLDMALQLLAKVSAQVQFDIYGPIEDRTYWQECQALVDELPANIQVVYKGSVLPSQVWEIFSRYHLFLFPTRGENFGHVLVEALTAGCPVLTSDQTPWHGLADNQAGWDIPLSQPEQFQLALNALIAMNDQTFERWSRAAQVCGNEFTRDPVLISANRELFLRVLSR